MLKVGYDTGNEIDRYIKHFDYDIMEIAEFEENEEQNDNIIDYSDDNYSSDDSQEIKNVDFRTKGDDSVMIKNISTQYPFLNKLCSSRILFRGPKGVVYLAFDPDISWDKMVPMLGMRNVVEGRCAGKKGNKDRLMPNKVRIGVSKGKQEWDRLYKSKGIDNALREPATVH
nr:F-box domain, leucine-rich repeat domain, L domain-like protein [Tanacetum cinerariifolium]